MLNFSPDDLRKMSTEMFVKVGVPIREAALVADHLVDSDMFGHDTHGVLRLPQYIDMVTEGIVSPGAPLRIIDDFGFSARLSGGWNFGPVSATRAIEFALEKLSSGAAMSVVTVRDCNHIARLGRFVSIAAKNDAIAIMTANGHGGDLAVAPFGGVDRRLPTNPIAVGIPTGLDWPVVLDMTTSMISGGDLRLLRNTNELAPLNSIIDAVGNTTRDTKDFYGPPAGAILPLGFPVVGHKGFGLSVLVDVLSGALSGAECSKENYERSGNALFIAVLRVSAFRSRDSFFDEVRNFIKRVKGSPTGKGFSEIMLPGEKAHKHYQNSKKNGIFVDDVAWGSICEKAVELDVDIAEVL